MLLPARTVKYIEALNREGDRFDYGKWLQRVREEEATQAEHVSAFHQFARTYATQNRQSSQYARIGELR